MYKRITVLVLVNSVLFSCHQGVSKTTVEDNLERPYPAISKMPETSPKSSLTKAKIKQIFFTATVKYMNLEGGFFGLIDKDGKHWLPMNLTKILQQDGAVVKVKGHALEGMMTIQQWGTPFNITHVELIEAGRNVTGKHLH